MLLNFTKGEYYIVVINFAGFFSPISGFTIHVVILSSDMISILVYMVLHSQNIITCDLYIPNTQAPDVICFFILKKYTPYLIE